MSKISTLQHSPNWSGANGIWKTILVFCISFLPFAGNTTSCDNVTHPGKIGYSEVACGSFDPAEITNVTSPSGGSGNLEIVWISSTDPEKPIWEWTVIPGANSLSYNPGYITETTYFRRCARRSGCTSWLGESNIISKIVNGKDGNCPSGAFAVDVTGNAKQIISNSGVSNANSILAAADDMGAQFYDHQDYLIVELDEELSEGHNYTISWKYRDYTSSFSGDAKLSVYESADGSNFTLNTTLSTDVEWFYISNTLTAKGKTKYLKLVNPSTSSNPSPDFDIDAISFCNVNCKSGTPQVCEVDDHNKSNGPDRLVWLNINGLGVKEYAVVGGSFFTESNDGTALLTGSVQRTDNPCYKWDYSVKLVNKRNWEDWSHLGRSYKPNNYITGEDHTKWFYYEVDENNSVFTGAGCNAGDELVITHNPTNFNFGFQVGEGANLKTADYGFSGWFLFSGDLDGHGDFNGDLDNCANNKTTISGFVWNDGDNDGIQESGEFGLPGVTVMLIDAAGNMVAQTSTDADGNYEFTNVAPGTYKVKFPKTGTAGSFTYNLTQPNQGSDDDIDSDPIGVGGTNDAVTNIFTVTFGDDVDNIDAGYYIGSKISGVAFKDENGNGIEDNGEGRINGITVMLLNADGTVMLAQTTTSGVGYYEFDNLPPGTYKVKFPTDETIQEIDLSTTNYSLTDANVGSDDTVDSDPIPMSGSNDAMTHPITVGNGMNEDHADAGYLVLANLGDFTYVDENRNGFFDTGDTPLQGVEVYLFKSTDLANALDTVKSNANGVYSFTKLDPTMDYVLQFNAPDNYSIATQTGNASDGVNNDSDANAFNGFTNTIDLNPGETDNTVDAGFTEDYGRIGNLAWIDNNMSGFQNMPLTDGRLQGVVVKLYLATDTINPIDTKTTTADGKYVFTDLDTDFDYRVQFMTRDGYILIPQTGNASDGGVNDSDADPVTGFTDVIDLNPGELDKSIDAGYYRLATIGDKVFIDENKDGLQDGGDSDFPNVTVMLRGVDVFGNTINLTTVTGSDGTYSFEDVAPGEYQIKFTAPNNYLFTEQDAVGNTREDFDSDADVNTGLTDGFTVRTGDVIDYIDAGLFFDPSLPVDLIGFEAQLINSNQVILKWATASELDNKHFVVERSIDGREYEVIGIVEGRGTTNQVNHYSLIDQDPFYGYNYYRLKQVDYDGKYEFSHVETVIISNDNLPDVIIYPNPVMDRTTIRVVTPFEQNANVEIVNQAGKIVEVFIMEAGSNSKQLDLSNQASGIYYAYINYNGHRTMVHKIVKVEE